ncbi:MAG: lipase [Betaproteobacteria bacterium]|nr:lipase [Betaproteobacteria bacterium]
MKNWHSLLFKFLGFIFFTVATPLAQAMPEECTHLTAPVTFIESNGLVCLQKVIVKDTSGDQLYQASLQWLGADKPNQFRLLEAEFDDVSEMNSPVFSLTTGLLTLPKVDVPKLNGTERYNVSLNWLKDSDSGMDGAVSLFELATVALYINPGYIPNVTWKPYGMLLPNERRAVDTLARSIPYAQLADAVYDFDNIAVGAWDLIEVNGKSSGMDAGLFRNRDTGELALVFRGTETCDIPCSPGELIDTGRDVAADIAISIGIVSDQFKDAFRFAQNVISQHPGVKITVAGHSLGGGLAQAVGSTLRLETFAFNSSPVPDDFFDTYTITLPAEALDDLIFVIADVHDPVSNIGEAGDLYFGSHHVTPLIQFNFKLKEMLSSRKVDLLGLRFDRHSITELTNNAIALLTTYRDGW